MAKHVQLGQHFLRDPRAISRVISAGNIEKTDVVLEIGPGTGVLTRELLAAARKVIAIERDSRLIETLRDSFKEEISAGRLILVEDDARDINLRSLGLTHRQYLVVANIPYYLTGHLLRTFLESDVGPSRMVLVMQKEVASRITMRKGERGSLLGMGVNAYSTPRYIATLKRGAFTPPPEVDSAILSIEAISKDFFKDISEKEFFALLKKGFAHKRKLLSSNLGVSPDVLTLCGLKRTARAEELSLSDWKKLALLETRHK